MPRARRPKRWGYDSRGTPFAVGCLPLIALVGALGAILWLAPDLVERCTGYTIEPGRARGSAGPVVLALQLVCSPLLLLGPWTEKALFALLLATIAALIWAWSWKRRHKAHWDTVRARERERRAERRRRSAEGRE